MLKRIGFAALMTAAFAVTAICPASAGVTSKTVTICHVPPGNPAAAQTLVVGTAAAEFHLAHHPDSLGSCGEGGA